MAHMSRLPRDRVLLLIEDSGHLQIEQTEWAPADAVASQRIGDEWLSSPGNRGVASTLSSRPAPKQVLAEPGASAL
jgi:hypothetical protein